MALSNPTPSDVHVNAALTNYGQMFMQSNEAFVALRGTSPSPQSQKSNEYFIYDINDMYSDDMAVRADASESAGGGFKLSTSPYACQVYAYHKDVGDQARANQDAAINLDNAATRFVTLKALIKMDVLFSAAYMGTGLWETELTGVSGTPSAGQFLKWNEPLSDPVQDVSTGKQVVLESTGYKPNTMTITYDTWVALENNEDIKARLGLGSGATTQLPAEVMREAVARILGVNLLVMEGVKTNAAATAREFISSNKALLYYLPPGGVGGTDLEPTAATRFSWTGYTGATESGYRVSTIRNELAKADRHEAEIAPDFRLTAPSMGYFFDQPA